MSEGKLIDTRPGSTGSLDVESVRAQFPALEHGTAFFDGPGGSQTPEAVTDAIGDALRAGLSNRDRGTHSGRRADDIVLAARSAIADLVGADSDAVVFGRSMTALTFDLARTLTRRWGPGDNVVVTSLDHDANIRPWVIAAESVGAQARFAHFDIETTELPATALAEVISERTRVVALTGASNILGTRPDVAAITELAHQVGALVFLDAVHLVPHARVDLNELGVDLLACSPYKFFGPHVGVLTGAPEVLESLSPDKLAPSPDRVPERFELGTLPYEMLAGVSAAVDFLASLAPDVPPSSTRVAALDAAYQGIHRHVMELLARLEDGLAQIPGVIRYSRAADRTPTSFFTVDGLMSAQVSQRCAVANINAPSNHFYALEASRRLGLGTDGAIRAGLAPYNTAAEVDALLEVVRSAAEYPHP
ncbi:MAG: cysteine desulfurase-like protein [Ornithinimicrobium sp.]